MEITETEMTSELCASRADRDTGGWWLSWLPEDVSADGPMTLNAAVTAMTVAEAIAAGARPSTPRWTLVRTLADEIGVDAVRLVERLGSH